jgi:hypothetical protein
VAVNTLSILEHITLSPLDFTISNALSIAGAHKKTGSIKPVFDLYQFISGTIASRVVDR